MCNLPVPRVVLSAALYIAGCSALAGCGGGDWHSDFRPFEAAYYACASSSGCSSAKQFRNASVTWQGKLIKFDPADGTVTFEMNEAKPPRGSDQIVCCFGPAKDKAQWAAIPVGATVTFRATIGKGSAMFAALAVAGSAIVYLGDFEVISSS